MEDRIAQELQLLRGRFSDLEYKEEGRWIRLPSFRLPSGWNREVTDVAFQILAGHPGTPPYGFYVPNGLLFNGQRPGSYTEPAANKPPFAGDWGMFSWAHDGQWRPTADLMSGSNFLNWVLTFNDRFREGQ